MLHKFIICHCEGDLSQLIISGEPTKEQLQAAWSKIMDERSNALRGKEQIQIESLTKDIELLQVRINAIRACVLRLSFQHSDEIVAELKKWINVREKFDTSDPESYKKDLEAIVIRSSKFLTELRHRSRELEMLVPKGDETKTDKWYYEKMIVQLEKHMGKSIIKSQTSVANFDFMLADLMAKVEAIDRQLPKA
jgi:hypothetical protein